MAPTPRYAERERCVDGLARQGRDVLRCVRLEGHAALRDGLVDRVDGGRGVVQGWCRSIRQPVRRTEQHPVGVEPDALRRHRRKASRDGAGDPELVADAVGGRRMHRRPERIDKQRHGRAGLGLLRVDTKPDLDSAFRRDCTVPGKCRTWPTAGPPTAPRRSCGTVTLARSRCRRRYQVASFVIRTRAVASTNTRRIRRGSSYGTAMAGRTSSGPCRH